MVSKAIFIVTNACAMVRRAVWPKQARGRRFAPRRRVGAARNGGFARAPRRRIFLPRVESGLLAKPRAFTVS
ncbi:MAG TPA: hypothetical protein VE360_15180, partial [Pyrinomonadaceae bacterium]|nr:hypothetical protein [Pyrinomonadaceae bacterium]